MSYEDNIERHKIYLTAITPIHIKGKDVDYGQGFVRRNSCSAYAIDHSKLGKYLFSKGKLDVYLEEVDRYINRQKFKEFDFYGFLLKYNLYDIEKSETHKELIEAGVFKGIVQYAGDKKFIRDGMSRAYIPGSSLKGFIRVACIYEYLKQKKYKNWLDLERDIRDYDRKLTDSFRFVSVTDSCEINIQNLTEKTVSVVSRNIHHKKSFVGVARVVEIFGKIKLETSDTKIYEIDQKIIDHYMLKMGDSISSFTLDKKGRTVEDVKISVVEPVVNRNVDIKIKEKEDIECFDGGVTFDIILNMNYDIPFSGISQILDVLDSFSQKIWDLEKKFFLEINENELGLDDIRYFYSQKRNANARFGFGTGLITKTPDGILDEVVLTELVNYFFPPRKELPHTRPKSRRIILQNNNAVFPLGWAKLQVIS